MRIFLFWLPFMCFSCSALSESNSIKFLPFDWFQVSGDLFIVKSGLVARVERVTAFF
jgi:hypothetical protein